MRIECDSDAYQMYDTLHQMGIEYESDTNQMYDSFHARFNDRRDMVMDECMPCSARVILQHVEMLRVNTTVS